MQDKVHKHIDSLVNAFFTVVNGEIFVWEAFEKELQVSGLPISVGRFIPLYYLAEKPMRLQELTERTHAKPSAASRLVERMVKDGLVEKRRDGCDGRAVELHVTPEGRRVEAQARAVFEQCVAQVFGDFTQDEVEELCMLISRMKAPGSKAGA